MGEVSRGGGGRGGGGIRPQLSGLPGVMSMTSNKFTSSLEILLHFVMGLLKRGLMVVWFLS